MLNSLTSRHMTISWCSPIGVMTVSKKRAQGVVVVHAITQMMTTMTRARRVVIWHFSGYQIARNLRKNGEEKTLKSAATGGKSKVSEHAGVKDTEDHERGKMCVT